MTLASIAKCFFIPINSTIMLVGLASCVFGALLTFFPGIVLDKVIDIVKESLNAQGLGDIFPESADDLKDMPYLYELGIALLALGAFLFVLSWCGWCGACCTSCCRPLLIVFSVILLVALAGEIAAGTMFLVEDSPLHENLRKEIKSKITSDFNETSNNGFSRVIILVNNFFDCCGVDGVKDFGNKDHRSCGVNMSVGCYTKLTDFIHDNIIWAGLILGAVLLLQLLQVVFAIAIFKDANKIGPG